MNLDIKTRDTLAQSIITSLERAVLGSVTLLRGSLANGTADACSPLALVQSQVKSV